MTNSDKSFSSSVHAFTASERLMRISLKNRHRKD